MAAFSDVIGAIVTEMTRARSLVDEATLELAAAYKEHPLLRSFPIPRLVVQETTIDLRGAVSGGRYQIGRLDERGRATLLEAVRDLLVAHVAEDPEFKQLVVDFPGLAAPMKRVPLQAVGKFEPELPVGPRLIPERVTAALLAVVRQEVIDALLNPDGAVTLPKLRRFLGQGVAAAEDRLRPRLFERLGASLSLAEGRAGEVDFLISAAELQAIPADRLMSVKLSIREADYSWTTIPRSDGSEVDRLVPL